MSFQFFVVVIPATLIAVWVILKYQSRRGDIFPLAIPFRLLNFVSLISPINIIRINSSNLKTLIRDHPSFGSSVEIGTALDKLCNDLNNPSCVMSGVGRLLYSQKLRDSVNKYNSVITYFEENPEVNSIDIEQPVLMTGLPRSGSTLMHKLLSEDPNCRGLCNWEMASFPTPPTTQNDYFSDPRIEGVLEQQKALGRIAPRLEEVISVMHHIEPLKVDEHHLVLDDAYMDMFAAAIAYTVPGQRYYKTYTGGLKPSFVYLKRYLQMKAHAYSPKSHWLLKNPMDSLTGIENLLMEFPDARIVLNHRDLMAVARSNFPLMKTAYGLYGYITDEHVIDFFLSWMDKATEDMIQIDKRYGAQVYNMHYENVRSDPIQAARNMYTHFGLEFSSQFVENMERYLTEDTHTHWKNPTPDDLFGDLRERYRDYYAHFGIT